MGDASFAPVEDFHGIVLTSGEDEISLGRVDLHAMDGAPVFPVMKIVLRFRGSVQVPNHHYIATKETGNG